MIQTEYNSILEWCQTCPELDELWAVSGALDGTNENVYKITGTAPLYSTSPINYVDGQAKVTGKPTDDYWEAITIQCYRPFVPQDNAYNEDNIRRKCEDICKWFITQQNEIRLPIIDGEPIYFIETLTPQPLEVWSDSQNQVISYDVVIRLHKKNPATRCDYVI